MTYMIVVGDLRERFAGGREIGGERENRQRKREIRRRERDSPK